MNDCDLVSGFEARRLIDPASTTDNTAVVSQIIDMANRSGVAFIINVGSLADADATFDIKLEESANSDMSSATDVSADTTKLLGTVSDFVFSADNTIVAMFGYRGIQRYLRVTITPAANTGASLISGVCYLRKKKVGVN